MYGVRRARDEIVRRVLVLQPHEDLVVKKEAIPHPLKMGFRTDLGEPRGQEADYRLEVRGRSVHAREYPKRWEIHWDKVDPSIDALEHLRRDSPGTFALTMMGTFGTVGGVIGSATGKKGNAAAGAVIGGLIGLLFALAVAEWE